MQHKGSYVIQIINGKMEFFSPVGDGDEGISLSEEARMGM